MSGCDLHVLFAAKCGTMAHEVARLLLEQADTFVKREEAVKTAIELGMPLSEIEEYLDWLEMVRAADSDESE